MGEAVIRQIKKAIQQALNVYCIQVVDYENELRALTPTLSECFLVAHLA